jgi:Holliday junction resolvasome RuvABC endonuclease subunit
MNHDTRIVSIDPTSHGFGFVVLEGATRLVDWGHASVRPCNNSRCLERIAELISWYHPDIVVIEDVRAPQSRRRTRVSQLLTSVSEYVTASKARIIHVSTHSMRRLFAEEGLFTKDEIAHAVAHEFPELSNRIPPRRRIWMSEDERSSIFDALALALTFFHGETAEEIA